MKLMTAVANNDVNQITEVERQFQRVNLALFGRYMLQNKREFPCQVTNMSPGSAALITPHAGELGETVIAYIDHLGRIEGKILRIFHGGFAMSVNATQQKRDKLAAKITWLANKHELNLSEDRRHERITPTRRLAEIKLESGKTFKAKLIDLSFSGAAIEMDSHPPMGSLVWIGNLRGRVVRHFDEGIAIEFAILQTHDSLREYIA